MRSSVKRYRLSPADPRDVQIWEGLNWRLDSPHLTREEALACLVRHRKEGALVENLAREDIVNALRQLRGEMEQGQRNIEVLSAMLADWKETA